MNKKCPLCEKLPSAPVVVEKGYTAAEIRRAGERGELNRTDIEHLISVLAGLLDKYYPTPSPQLTEQDKFNLSVPGANNGKGFVTAPDKLSAKVRNDAQTATMLNGTWREPKSPAPVVDGPCPACDGKGIATFGTMKCSHCHGTGREGG